MSTASTLVPPSPPPLTTASSTSNTNDKFTFPPHYSFPPFFTLQPVLATRTSQLLSWSTLIQSYCRAHHLFSLTLVDALSTPLFHNSELRRGLSSRDARTIVHWMTTPEGGNRAEWILSTSSTGGGIAAKKGTQKVEEEGDGKVWIYWRRPEEWAQVLEEWVDRTGQKGSVITLYEIAESDATRKEDFWGMDADLLKKSVAICVNRGRAQVFGSEGNEGVKFF
jgi:ESCRT-II complex subunit VPS25